VKAYTITARGGSRFCGTWSFYSFWGPL